MENPLPNSIQKFAARLFGSSDQRDEFLHALSKGNTGPKALIWTKPRPGENPFPVLAKTPWLPGSVDLVEGHSLPGSHPLHEQGAYYCVDSSSVFAGSIFCELQNDVSVVLDMCASPGGKTTLASVELQPSSLYSNETIGKRHRALVSNIRRCALERVLVTKHDPSYFAEQHPGKYDLVIVDAPCSGQSLVAKGKTRVEGFHPSTINMNSNRQKRIVVNAASAVRPGGYLAYMTCTFAREENEGVLEWLQKKIPGFSPVPSEKHSAFSSQFADFPCYRLWPQHGYGAGGFTALLQKN